MNDLWSRNGKGHDSSRDEEESQTVNLGTISFTLPSRSIQGGRFQRARELHHRTIKVNDVPKSASRKMV